MDNVSIESVCEARSGSFFVCSGVPSYGLAGLAQATTITIPNTYWCLGTNSSGSDL